MWFWIIYFAISFVIAGIVSISTQENDGTMTSNGCIAAIIAGAFWPVLILSSIGYQIGKNSREKNDSTKHD